MLFLCSMTKFLSERSLFSFTGTKIARLNYMKDDLIYLFTQRKNYLDHNPDCNLDANLDHDPEMYSFTQDAHCSIQQSTSHCCSLFNHCYIAIHLIS